MQELFFLGLPVSFILFALTLLGVAVLHRHVLAVALAGLIAILAYKLAVTGFADGPGLAGLAQHLGHEKVIIGNLLLLLTGFALLSRHFEKSRLPLLLPKFLPDDWRGGFLLLLLIFILSSFLDNIAGALIGGVMAHTLFRGRIHIGYLAAIVAAANAGGAGSVVGDTTTTMLWLSGVSPFEVLKAYIASGIALLVFGVPLSILQQKFSPILKHSHEHTRIDWPRLGIVASMLVLAVGSNVFTNLFYPALEDKIPVIGLAVWGALLLSVWLRRPDWEVLPEATQGAVFLCALVLSASLMPVAALPAASWPTTLGLGFVSAGFDNIPLTALAVRQGGYDWGFLAYAVGFGGSMLWFGSSAGVALANLFPEAKSVSAWLRYGWPVAVAYILGFFGLLMLTGWHPALP